MAYVSQPGFIRISHQDLQRSNETHIREVRQSCRQCPTNHSAHGINRHNYFTVSIRLFICSGVQTHDVTEMLKASRKYRRDM